MTAHPEPPRAAADPTAAGDRVAHPRDPEGAAAPDAGVGAPLVTLAQSRIGIPVQVHAVTGDDDLARRLDDQGLWPGAAVELITTALGGDPLLFRLHGYRLALRRDEAARVTTVPLADPGREPGA
ncbi:MAG: ferrous iron transport protein A [Planctomycetota bacterium]